VNELSAQLNLTDNAIRANLLTLERDRLVEQTGSVKGFRKPHFAYALTDEARHLFPKAYDSLLVGLLAVLKERLSPAALASTLRDLGRRFGSGRAPAGDNAEARLNDTLHALEELGGHARVVTEDGKVMIKSDSCPFSEAVAEHPEVCHVAESMIGEIVGHPVRENCDRSGSPKCCFDLGPEAANI
jgi:predicted ArsR family transcriptional regulator